jgi:hypothetical protein
MIQKLIIQTVTSKLLKKFKLDKVLDYVENENVLDRKVKKLEKRIKKLETDAIKFHTGTDLK